MDSKKGEEKKEEVVGDEHPISSFSVERSMTDLFTAVRSLRCETPHTTDRGRVRTKV